MGNVRGNRGLILDDEKATSDRACNVEPRDLNKAADIVGTRAHDLSDLGLVEQFDRLQKNRVPASRCET